MKTSKEFKRQLEKVWVKLGLSNLWICKAHDPPFDKSMIYPCETLEELKNKFAHGNWCLGQGYSYKNFCFINQINAGDEWLSIKDNFVFESASLGLMIEKGSYDKWIERVLSAPSDRLRVLDY